MGHVRDDGSAMRVVVGVDFDIVNLLRVADDDGIDPEAIEDVDRDKGVRIARWHYFVGKRTISLQHLASQYRTGICVQDTKESTGDTESARCVDQEAWLHGAFYR